MAQERVKGGLSALSAVTGLRVFWSVGSCVVVTGIPFTDVQVQRLLSVTGLLVLVNMNTSGIIFITASIMGAKTFMPLQAFGAAMAISAGILYGQTKKILEETEISTMAVRCRGDRRLLP